ncbi:receptor-like protein EIX2 isoform X4 [Ipomoea triloba]|uniref:receptor-like protein EIX2 isoform X4 n=1 Tax=Ipomoea triloba TaxID=35885 RepID=UPI00125CFB59|nr:receptor-like protein EIX2 isoform X4 [Ipomoea triloba]
MMRICGSDLRWLLFLLIIVQYLNGSRSCFENERNALLSFKHTIISDPFSSLSSWGASRDDDCCKWKGIGCDNTTGHVVALHLEHEGLQDDERMPELYFDTFEDPMEEVFFDSEWLIWKGIEREYGKNLKFMKFIDLSSNKLVGEIPIEITDLHMLNSLNLSRNKLTGSIPDKIGQMSSLESLDLSNNQLSGAIPFSMASISFLAHLDLSNNNLSGCIPLGPQLQGFTEAYQGNSKLRGPPLQTKCHRDEPGNAPQQGKIDEIEDDEYWIIWDFDFFVSMALGFILGFWGVCGTLILKRSWRHAYFQFLEDKKENIFTAILVYGAKLKRGMGAS